MIKITMKDWLALCNFVEIGILDTVEAADDEYHRINHAYYKDFKQFRMCEKRVRKQIAKMKEKRRI